MDFSRFQKILAQNKVYDAWQYVQSLNETLDYMSMSEELLERNVYGGPNGRHHRRYRGTSIGYRLRYRLGSIARKRYYHRYHRRIYHLPNGR